MPTDPTFAELIVSLLQPERVWTRQQFGSYCLYHNHKPVAFLQNGQVLLKPTDPPFFGAEELERVQLFPGSRMYYIAPDDRLDTPWFRETILEISSLVPAPKPRKKDVEKPTRRR